MLVIRDEWKIYLEICSELVKKQKPINFDLTKQWWKDHQIEGILKFRIKKITSKIAFFYNFTMID
ncbi:hypothetical protein BpHYR1_053874 [Brachionus plicatilis]|uniref:Uncharacterized protein n=1 Tax=Brachionus plicatilis TaxID=10195 RepID=A0A3M7QLH4_BRAPC|nr:hypothetical protein BpHYR1_053874 [Brachionus plicatilis]